MTVANCKRVPSLRTPEVSTKRTPIVPPHRARITPRAVELFDRMRRAAARCVCDDRSCSACRRWGQLMTELHDELDLKLWEATVEDPAVECPGWADVADWDAAQERWRALAAASRAAKRAARKAKASEKAAEDDAVTVN
jgi:hypothetical protein